jgi:hemoglobin/transferrin/lactoferrin receptor protein
MKYLVNMRYVVFLSYLFLVQGVFAQEIVILDSDSRNPIGNVVVYNTDKSKTALSDFDGKCDLSSFAANDRLTISHIGYQSRKTTKSQLLKKGTRIYLIVKTQQLDEVVMSISKWEQQKKDIPQKITSISARAIAFSNPQTSADVLQSSGQVYVQKSQLGGGSPMIRGFATNRLLLAVDGVRMNNAIFRGGNIQNVISIDPYAIRNTEIIFGPGSVIYGSDAIGGVMNFLTLQPQFIKKDSIVISGKGDIRFSSANTEKTFHTDINLASKKWAFLSSITYNNFDDLYMGSNGPDAYLRNTYVDRRNGTDVLVANSNPKKQVTTGYNQINFIQKIAHKPNSNWQYDIGLYLSETSEYSRYDRLIRPTGDGLGLRSAEWYYGPQKWFMGNIQVYKKGRSKFYDGVKVTAAYQFFEESRNDRDFQDLILNRTKEKVHAFSTNIDFENKKLGDLRLYYGGEYIHNKVLSNGSVLNIDNGALSGAASRYPNGSTWQTLAAYINGEYKANPAITFLSGLRYSHVWIDAPFETTYYSFPFNSANLNNGALTGSLGFSWFPKPSLQVTLNGSTGFRAPNIDDIGKVFDSEPGAVVVPNPDLEPEYAYNVEVGVRKNFNDKAMFKGAAFYTYLVDALVRRDFTFNGETEILYNGEVSTVQTIQNAAKAYVYGFEFGAEVFLSKDLSVASNLTITEGVEEEANGEDSPARHAAPTFGDFHFIWSRERFKADLFLNFNGEISFNDLALTERNKEYIYAQDSNGNPYAPSWHTLNFRSQFQINPSMNVSFALENITDQRYRTYSSGITAPGINLIIGLGVKF